MAPCRCVDLTNCLLTNSGADILMNTTDCSPFESFAKEDIELWVVVGEPSNGTSQVDAADIRYDILCLVACSCAVAHLDTRLDCYVGEQADCRARCGHSQGCQSAVEGV